jgi:hypothetical protein
MLFEDLERAEPCQYIDLLGFRYFAALARRRHGLVGTSKISLSPVILYLSLQSLKRGAQNDGFSVA